MSEPNAIDSKKTETSSSEPNDYPGFFNAVYKNVLSIFISFVIIGCIGLYTCKVAQANVLTDDIKFQPFGDKVRNVEEIPINMNIIKKYGFFGFGIWQKPEKTMSTKIVFDNQDIIKGYQKGFIGFLNSFKDDPERANFFGLYVRDVFVNVIAKDNVIINKVFEFMNKYLPESLIILLFPMIAPFFYTIFFLVNCALCFYYQIKCGGDFFMDKGKDDTNKNKVKWFEPFTYLEPVRMFCLFLYGIFLFFPFLILLPLIITIYSVLSPLGIAAKSMNTNMPINFLNFMKDTLLYKKQLYLFLMTFGLLNPAATFLGQNAAIGCVIAILIVFFSFHLYDQTMPSDTKSVSDGLVSNDQAKIKEASVVKNLQNFANKQKEKVLNEANRLKQQMYKKLRKSI